MTLTGGCQRNVAVRDAARPIVGVKQEPGL